MKRWGLGIYHGLRDKHLDTYLNEFAFRYNRRFYRHVSFETVLGIASRSEPPARGGARRLSWANGLHRVKPLD
jgi:ISXO2-like transposase domain